MLHVKFLGFCGRRRQSFPKITATELFDTGFLREKDKQVVDKRRSACASNAFCKKFLTSLLALHYCARVPLLLLLRWLVSHAQSFPAIKVETKA